MAIDRLISVSSEVAVEPIVVQQNDRNSRTLRFCVYDGSKPYPFTGKRIRCYFRKNGATSQPYEANYTADGWVELTLDEAVTAHAGVGEMQLVVEDGEYLLHSFTIPFIVKSSLSFMGETENPADDPMAVNWKNLPGKPDTFPPASHTHTPEEAGALPADGTAANASSLGGKPAEFYRPTRNLLVNSGFSFNQRGQANYTGAVYGVDCWVGMSRTSVTVDELGGGGHGVLLKNTAPASGTCYLQQLIPKSEICEGCDYTLAAKINGEIVLVTGKAGVTNETSGADWALTFLYSTASGKYAVRITLKSGVVNAIDVDWVALYKGAYTADSLPDYAEDGTAAEQQKVRQYHRRYNFDDSTGPVLMAVVKGNRVVVVMPLPDMYSTPTVSAGGKYAATFNTTDGDFGEISLGAGQVDGPYVIWQTSLSGIATPGVALLEPVGSGAYIDLSCEQ